MELHNHTHYASISSIYFFVTIMIGVLGTRPTLKSIPEMCSQETNTEPFISTYKTVSTQITSPVHREPHTPIQFDIVENYIDEFDWEDNYYIKEKHQNASGKL